MSGFEIVGLIGLLETCHHGYKAFHNFVRQLRNMGKDFVELDLRLEEADAYLISFGRINDLIPGRYSGQPAQDTEDMPSSWKELVYKRLVIMRDDLKNAEAIMTKYKFQEYVDASAPVPTANSPNPSPTMCGSKTLLTQSPGFRRAEKDIQGREAMMQRSSPWNKLTWSTHDKKALTEAVELAEKHSKALFNLTTPRFWLRCPRPQRVF